MATSISWTKKTWNPITGCSKVSAGCSNCYAVQPAYRMSRNPNVKIRDAYAGTAAKHDNGRLDWTGRVNCLPSRLSQPLRWRNPSRIFVNSMSDLFHDAVPDEFIGAVFDTMAKADRHTYQILTKRAERMASWPGPWLPHIWAGVTVEDRRNLYRLDLLRECRAAIRWVSFEPLLEGLGDLNLSGIDWVVVGAESGPRRRPFAHSWARSIKDQCANSGIAFFFKQDAGAKSGARPWLIEADGSRWTWHQYPGDLAQPWEVQP